MLTIAIITKNRPANLYKCLHSIAQQTCKEFGVLIVDNDSNGSAKHIYKNVSKRNHIPVTYICEPQAGYANARNCGLVNCNSRYIGFIDDDCELNPHWVSAGLEAIRKYQSAYIVGKSIEPPEKNLFESVENYFHAKTNQNKYHRDSFEMVPFMLDTKNVILDAYLLKKNNIAFDKQFNRYGGEDADIGLQIKHSGEKGYFADDMIVYHNHTLDFKGFKRKAYSYGFNSYSLYHKWSSKNDCTDWHYHNEYKLFNSFKSLKTAFLEIRHVAFKQRIAIYIIIKMFNYCYLKGFYCRKKQIHSIHNKTYGYKNLHDRAGMEDNYPQ
jgi:glycosyltransferase involved in cell wall biosynthesis